MTGPSSAVTNGRGHAAVEVISTRNPRLAPARTAGDRAVRVSILGQETITVGYNLDAHASSEIVAQVPASTYVVATDANVAALHLSALEAALRAAIAAAGAKSRVLSLVVPPGEAAKTRETKGAIEDWMLSQACTRDTCIIALGGGVIGDMLGFVAATFMRGIPVIQMPTTLLAMVDSSIGGKTAVDTLHGKNLVGSFHQPRHIYIDLKYLRTLPHREFVNGLAEVIKTAAIWDADDFALLENNADEILALNLNKADISEETDHSLLMRVILGSVRVKAYVVTIDEKETGLRGLLNFGHSVGHAIEAILAPELLHGECVSMGMIKEAEISRHLGYLNDVDVGRLSRCLQAYGLPLGVEDKRVRQLAPSKFCPVDRLLDIMRVDKKNMGDRKRIVLLSSIGQPFEERATFVEDIVIRKILSPSIEVVPVAPGLKSDIISLTVPGSKSLSNRSLVLAALGKGTCRLKGLLHSDDVQVMLDALQKLVGISYSWEDKGETLVVTGGAGKLQVPNSEIYLGNAGTAARFLTTVCSLVREASGGHSHTVVTGNARMKQRPIAHLVDALRSNGCTIEYLESEGCLPLKIHPNGVGLKGGLIKLSANISSQYVSSILLSAPYATAPVTLELIGNAVVSQPYIDMTLAMMASFGINVKREGDNIYHIPQGVYTNPDVYLVEADASSATYPLAFAAITGQTVKVTNIGSSSLQGDAEFAVKVLKTMGCDVTQTSTETTVEGPKFLRPIPQIDMESMTDAFLTASVLAAVAVGADGRDHTTRITGIANQRVKECNRIAAMVAELGKFGVRAGELPDGIEIHGTGNGGAGLRVPEGGVKCYDDHRVAMSFSVLACAMPGGLRAIINEKKCVEKTWPSWWDTLETKLGVRLLGVDISHGGTNSGCTSATYSDKDLADDSIVFIGMRGAGKSSMGRAVSRAFGWSYIDMDAYFEARENTAIPAFVTKHGWDEFRRRERAHLQAVLAENPKRCVITCGGGIIETPESRSILTSWSSGSGKRHVIHLRRCIDDIVAYLLKDPTRPVYGEDTRAVWARREPLYRACATSEFFSLRSSDGSFSAAERELIRLIRFLHRQSGQPPLAGFSVSPSFPRDSSFFVSLTVPDVREALDSIRLASEGADAFELRVDLLGDQSDEFILQQIAALRRTADIPIVFTVRTCSQGGEFPDADETRMFDLLHRAVAWGCEFVDVEVLDTGRVERRDLLQKFVQKKGNSHLIASYHDVSGTAVWVESSGMGVGSMSGQVLQSVVRMRDKLDELARYGDSVKLIGRAKSIGDNFALQQFVWTAMTRGNATKPLIAINMGAEGQMSRILNSYMTPVTHPALPTAAAPGQLSVAEIHRGRALLGLLDRRRFFLFGSPISASPSPAMHNAGFDCLGLPYTYELSEGADPEHVKAVVQAAVNEGKFGGASVTIPHKETVMRLGILSSVTDAARTIGAVNTLIPSKDGIVGDNTDWLGIKACILQTLGADTAIGTDAIARQEEWASGRQPVGIVIGAGGTARAALFALQRLGLADVRVWNRGEARGAAVAQEFGAHFVGGDPAGIFVAPPAAAAKGTPLVWVVVSAVPGPAQESLGARGLLERAEAAAPAGSAGVVVELAYRPRETALLAAATSGSEGGFKWARVRGEDILLEQGVEQFERWTGRRAPRRAMAAQVLQRE